jgi:ATPase subunit of ABC transporter with duplicated ATPase domains
MLTVSQLSKSFAGRALFDDVSLQVSRGDRIGLVGPNEQLWLTYKAMQPNRWPA